MNTDLDKVADQLFQRLDKMAEWMESAGSAVIDIYVQKAQLISGAWAFSGISVLGMGILLFRFGLTVQEKPENPPRGLVYTGASVIAGMGTLLIYRGFMQLMIPEYYALRELLRLWE